MGLRSLIAQSVERRTVNPQVPGSSPGRGAKVLWYVPDTWFTLCTEHILYTFPITSRLLWDQKDSRWHSPFEIPDQSNPYRNP